MIDVTWKLFCQTGNIETYLLLKELEKDPLEDQDVENEHSEETMFDTLM